jgi:hypothetical protein
MLLYNQRKKGKKEIIFQENDIDNQVTIIALSLHNSFI